MQVDDLRLNRDVERGDRLVADEELRVQCERARKADALALPARELVRIPVRGVLGQADGRQELVDAGFRLAPGRDPVHAQRLADDLADRVTRVQ